jgi:hypothetical protein
MCLKKIRAIIWPSNLLNPQQEIDVWVAQKLSELSAGARITGRPLSLNIAKYSKKGERWVFQLFGAIEDRKERSL